MHTYRIEITGLRDRRSLKAHLEANPSGYRLPAYITVVAAGEAREYYAEESNVNRGKVIVVDRWYNR